MVDANREIVVGAPPNNITNTVNNNKNNNNHYSAPQHHNTGGVPVYTQEYSLPHVNHVNSAATQKYSFSLFSRCWPSFKFSVIRFEE